MQNKIKQTVKHTVFYSIGTISTKLAGLILLPFYTNYITIQEYGMLGIIETTTVFLSMILGLNMYTAVMRWFATAKDEHEKKLILSSAFIPTLIFVITATFVLSFFVKPLSLVFFDTEIGGIYFIYTIFSVICVVINSFATAMIRMQEKPLYFSLVNISSLVITVILNIYLTAFLHWGLEGILISQLVGNIILILLFLPALLKFLILKIDKKLFIEMTAYSIPLIMATLSSSILNMGDRYIIPFYLSYAALGVYAVAYKISNVISTFIIASFQLSFFPLGLKMFEKDEAPQFFAKILTYFTAVLLLAALGVSLFSKELLLIFAPFNEEYRIGAKYIPFLAFLLVFKGMEYVIMLPLFYKKKTKYNALILIIGAIINISLNILLIKYLELYGVAISSLIAGIIVSYLYLRYANKIYPIRYEWNRIIKLFTIAITLLGITYFFTNFNIALRIILKSCLIILFPILLYIFKFFNKTELVFVKDIYLKWRNPKYWRNNMHELMKNRQQTK